MKSKSVELITISECACTKESILPGSTKPEYYTDEKQASKRFKKLLDNAQLKTYEQTKSGEYPKLADLYFCIHINNKHIIAYKR